jgi:serine/threonine protein kinase
MGACIDKYSQYKATNEEPPLPVQKKAAPPPQKVITEMSEYTTSSKDLVGLKKTPIRNDYNIVQPPLGSGTYGQVYKAIHKPTSILRAIKAMNKEYISPAERRKLLNEVNIMKNLVRYFLRFINERLIWFKSL